MRKIKNFERIMLIVCEGTKTEPQYFEWLRDNVALPSKIWDKIEISSNTILPNDIVIPKKGELNTKRKPRNLKFENPNKRKQQHDVLKELWEYVYGDIDSEKYEDIKAQPIRYVAQAQCLHEHSGGVYDEIWAVFDKNGHLYHKEAFERANKLVNGLKTNIAFSSRSFEHWILLHFEKNKHPFKLTVCKDDKNQVIGCNENTGCKGKECLVGYIRSRHYPSIQKSYDEFELQKFMVILYDRIDNALENALWLKDQNAENRESGQQIYELTPYTDVDDLVKSILKR